MASALFARTWAKVRYYRRGLSLHLALLRVTIDVLAKLGARIEFFHLVLEGLALSNAASQSPLVSGVEVRFLTANEMPILATLPGRLPSQSDLQRRLQEGKRCLGVWQRETLLAFTWCDLNVCCFEEYPLFRLQANEAYLFDAYTLETARGSGIAPFMRQHMYEELAKLGRDTCFSVTVLFNIPAARFKAKLGARIIELHLLIEIFKHWRWHRVLRRYQ